jgi:hypothetical protein
MPGVITLYKDAADASATGIVDGQHRVAALLIMSEAGAWDQVWLLFCMNYCSV